MDQRPFGKPPVSGRRKLTDELHSRNDIKQMQIMGSWLEPRCQRRLREYGIYELQICHNTIELHSQPDKTGFFT